MTLEELEERESKAIHEAAKQALIYDVKNYFKCLKVVLTPLLYLAMFAALGYGAFWAFAIACALVFM